MNSKIEQALEFIVETDKLKRVYRQTLLSDRSRQENSAEHSWHLALMAVLLKDAANEPDIDLLRTIQMLLIHDIVEIDAGDTFAYDDAGHEDKEEREQQAANRLFGMLPEEQAAHFHALWREFEERKTPEARFAAALDRLHPMMLNFASQGAAWKKHGITRNQVHDRNHMISEGSASLWEYATSLIERAVDAGYLDK